MTTMTPARRVDTVLYHLPMVGVGEVRVGDTIAVVYSVRDATEHEGGVECITVGTVTDLDTTPETPLVSLGRGVAFTAWDQLRMVARAPVPEPTGRGAVIREDEAHGLNDHWSSRSDVPAGSVWVRHSRTTWVSVDRPGAVLSGRWAEVFHRPVVLYPGVDTGEGS